jgi:hypothetical protein
MGAQPRGDEQCPAAVDDAAEQAGKAPSAERTSVGRPVPPQGRMVLTKLKETTARAFSP